MPDVASAVAARSRDLRPWTVAQLLAVDEVMNRGQVSIDGGPAVWLPMSLTAYEDITTVFVTLDPFDSGVGPYISGACGQQPAAQVPPPPPPQPPADTPDPVTRTVIVRPTWSGTWRNIRSAYDRWNESRYGGRSTLYQGSSFGSGTLVGLATYGSQVTALGALTITEVIVTTKIATGSGTVVLQGAPHPSRPAGAPAPTGDTASGTTAVALTAAMREDLRTGAARSLVAVGSAYRGTYGTSRADGMALRITYTRPA